MGEDHLDATTMERREYAHNALSFIAAVGVAWYLTASDYFGVRFPWLLFLASAGFALLFLVGVLSERLLLGEWFATKKRWATYSKRRRWAEGWSMWVGIALGATGGWLA